MNRRTLMILTILALFATAIAHPISAQTVRLNETYTTADGLSFRYPSSLDVETSNGQIVVASETVGIIVITPTMLEAGIPFETDMTSLRTVLDSFEEGAVDVEFGRAMTVQLDNDVSARRVDFFPENAPVDSVAAAFVLAVEVGDTFAAMIGTGDDDEEVTEIAYAIASTFEVSESGSLDLPTLDEAASGAADAVDELIDLELISDEGEALYTEDILSTSLGGNELDSDSESQFPNAAMSALLSFRPVDAETVCGFLARSVENQDGGLDEFIFVGVTPENEVIVLAGDRTGDDNVTETFPADVDFYSPNQLTFVLRDNRVIVWVNGEPLVDTEVNLTAPNTRGTVPRHQMGTLMANSCVMTGAWGYGFESDGN